MDYFIRILKYFPMDICEIIARYVCIINMMNYLQHNKVNFSKFLEFLKERKCVVTGSFPLSCLLNEDILCESDIDIMWFHELGEEIDNKNKYVQKWQSEMVDEIKKKLGLHSTRKILQGITENYERNLPYIIKCETYTNTYKRGSIKCNNHFKLQMVGLICDPIKFINETADFEIGKLFFDGEMLHVKDLMTTMEKRIRIADINIVSLFIGCDSKIVGQLECLKTLLNKHKQLLLNKNFNGFLNEVKKDTIKDKKTFTLAQIIVDRIMWNYNSDKPKIIIDMTDRRMQVICDQARQIGKTLYRIDKYKKRGFIFE